MRELDDDAAYMLLASSNAQSELTALEHGLHALKSGMSGRAYAESVGHAHRTVADEIAAAEVAEACADIRPELGNHFSQLVTIHAAPKWLWPMLVDVMLGKQWTVEVTRARVAPPTPNFSAASSLERRGPKSSQICDDLPVRFAVPAAICLSLASRSRSVAYLAEAVACAQIWSGYQVVVFQSYSNLRS